MKIRVAHLFRIKGKRAFNTIKKQSHQYFSIGTNHCKTIVISVLSFINRGIITEQKRLTSLIP